MLNALSYVIVEGSIGLLIDVMVLAVVVVLVVYVIKRLLP